MRYTVVVPAYNEVESVRELYSELVRVLEELDQSFEILWVDDGSTDGTGQVLSELAATDERVSVLAFERNLGKSAAYDAAFRAARGEVLITLDADLQDDPAELPKLLAKLEQGGDLVVGWKMGRMGNEPRKTIPSRFFNLLNYWLFGLRMRDTNSGYRVMRRVVAQSLVLYGDQYRFIPQLAHQRGYTVLEEGVVHRRRRYGVSKYGVTRFWTGLLDLLTVRFLSAWSDKPLHFFGTVGLVPLVLGGLLELYVLAAKLLGSTFQTHVAAIIIGVTLILTGVQLVLTGLLGELLRAQRHQVARLERER